MSNDIKKITEKIRLEREQAQNGIIKSEIVTDDSPQKNQPSAEKKAEPKNFNYNLNDELEIIKSLKVEGKNKSLIRIDDKHVRFLSQLKCTLGLDTTKFLNHLIENFVVNHPEIKTLIKDSLKNSLKDL